MKVETIHKELDGLSSNEALRDLFDVAIGVVTKNHTTEITVESLPLIFLLGALLPTKTILTQAPKTDQLEEFETLAQSAKDALKAQGCIVMVQDEQDFMKNPPDDLTREEKKELTLQILNKLVDRVCTDMPRDLKDKMEQEVLERLQPGTSTVN